MQPLIQSTAIYPGFYLQRRSLFVGLLLLAASSAGLQAQTTPAFTSNFTVGPADGSGALTVQADWSTVSNGTDRFETNPGSYPVGDTSDNGSTPTKYATRFDMTIGDGANLFASGCASVFTPGLLNFAGPGSGTNSKLVNFGNLNSYYANYPSQYPTSEQTWGTVNLNYVDFTNYGNVGTLTGVVGFTGPSGTGNSYTVDASNGTVTNYGTISGQNTLGSNGAENYGHLVARFGKGILNRANAPVNNYTSGGVLSGYNGSYGFDGIPDVHATWNNWGYISWWTTGVQMFTSTATFSDYGGPLVPCALSNSTAANGGTTFGSGNPSTTGGFAPANEGFATFDLTYGGMVTCGYNDSDPFSSTYAAFNYGLGAAVIGGVNRNANFYNTVYTISQAGTVTPAGTKVNFFPVLIGPLTSGGTSPNDSANDPSGVVSLYFDGLSPSEIQDVQYAVAQTSIYTQGILANNGNGTTTYVVPRGTAYQNYYAAGTGNVDQVPGALASGPGHSAYVTIRGATYNWLDFLNVTLTHNNDLTADPVPGVFTGTTQAPAYYLNPAGNIPQTAVGANVAGTYVSSGQARDVGSTLSGLSANPGGVSALGAVVQLEGQTTSTQNGTYAVTALSPGGALLRLNPALPPAAYTLDDAGAILTGTGNLAASLTPASPAPGQGAAVHVTMQANPVQNGYYTIGALTANTWTLVRSPFFQGNTSSSNPTTYATTASLAGTYQSPSFANSGGVAKLTGAGNGPILLDVAVTAGDVVLVVGRGNPTAGGIYFVQSAGSATAPWVLTRLSAEAGVGALWVTSANLAANYASSGQPGDVGSTLTASHNAALPTSANVNVDVGTVVLVNAQTAPAQNGVYKISALGDTSHPWVLVRVQLTQSGTVTAASEAAALRSLIYPAGTGAMQVTVYTETNSVTNIGTDPIQFTVAYSTSRPREKYNYTSPTTVTLTGNQGLTAGATTNVQAGWALQIGSQAYGDDIAMTSPNPTGSIVLDSAVATASGYNVDGQTNTSKVLTGSLVLQNGLLHNLSNENIAQAFTPNTFLQTTNPNHQVASAIANDTRLYTTPPPPAAPSVTLPVYLPDIRGTGDLFQSGTGTTYLTTALTGFTGTIYMSHGRLVLAPSTTLASCGVTMESWDSTQQNSGVLDCSNIVNGQLKLRWLQGVQNPLGNGVCKVPGIALATNKLLIGYGRASNDPAMVYQGQINGTGGLELLGGVEMTLGGSVASYNTYSGGTVIDPGALLHVSTFPMEADGSSRMLGTGDLTNNGAITLVAGNTQDGGNYSNGLTNLPSTLQRVGAMGSGGNHLVYVGGNYRQSGSLTLKINSVGASVGGSLGLATVSDSLQAAGSITLQPGATLMLSEVNPATIFNATTVALAQGASISGTFSGLPDGANVLVGGNLWTIHYLSTQITLTGPAVGSLRNRATGGTATASKDNPPNESAAMAFDGSTSTKWFNNNGGTTGTLAYHFGGGLSWIVKEYTMSSANDVPGRDPKDWQFQGSNDGTTWTTLDTQTGQTFAARYQTNNYPVANTVAYAYYRLNITANNGDASGLQLSELSLYARDVNPPVISVPANMTVPATGSNGAVVTFSTSATDDTDGAVATTSNPASGSTFPIGTTVVTVSAQDSSTNQATKTFQVTVQPLTSYQNWQLQYFGTTSATGPAADLADPDGDGVPNLLEYALGSNPTSAASTAHPSVSIVNNHLSITFNRAQADVTYLVEVSADLGAWTVIATDPGSVGGSVTAVDPTVLAPGNPPRRFIRLRVTRP